MSNLTLVSSSGKTLETDSKGNIQYTVLNTTYFIFGPNTPENVVEDVNSITSFKWAVRFTQNDKNIEEFPALSDYLLKYYSINDCIILNPN